MPGLSFRRLLVWAGAAAVVAAAGAGVYGLIAGPPAHPDQPAPPTTTTTPAPTATAVLEGPTSTAGRPGPWEDLPGLPATTDPVVYAEAVAEALLSWDTMSGLAPADYARPVIADADPSGYETPGLVSDVANYFPSDAVWDELRQYATRQSVTIDDAFVPDEWASIEASAPPGELRDGTTAVTVEATRHRSGEWLDQPASSDHPLTFTVFVACPPAFDRCHTLRLSLPDQPIGG